MSGFKGTPGPWRVGITTDSYEIEVVSDARPYVCMTLPGALDGVTEANARLIAAAPELLTSLQSFVAAVEDDGEPLPGARWHAEHVAARAAIAKATGSQP